MFGMTSLRRFLVAVFCFVLSVGIPEVSCNMPCDVPIFNECPNNIFDQEKSYCCAGSAGAYCCELSEFTKMFGSEEITTAFTDRMSVAIPVLLVLAVIVLGTTCLCCFCCPCCLLYKRRHNGTVYGRVQPPTTVVTVQQPAPAYPAMPVAQPMGAPMPQPGMPGYLPPAGYPDYTAMQGQQQQAPPPPYNIAVANEGYVKQAPYNPNY